MRPNHAPAYVRLGDVLVKQNQPTAARQAYHKAVKLDDHLAKAHRGLGQVLLMLGETEDAVRELERAAQRMPEDGAIFAALAQGYTRLNDRARANEAAVRSRGLKQIYTLPDPAMQEVSAEGISSALCLRRAKLYIEAGQYREAIPDLKICAEVNPDHAGVQRHLGRAYSNIGEPESAILHLTRALELKDDLNEARVQLASLLTNQGRTDEAVEQYQRVLDKTPDDAAVRTMLAGTLARRGDSDEAIAEFERAAALGPLTSIAYNNWGNALRQKGDLEAALERYRQAVRLEPAYANAHYNMGVAFERLNRADEAIAHFRRAVEIDPKHPAAHKLEQLSPDTP
ncbi:MAG: tetratricopeptide repeat protein [Planctomycetes bacterium]|nr:tetratricopeptide repeat protein [Planctomycetota bacterium]